MLLGDVKVEDIVIFILIFFLTFFGSITKDYLILLRYNTQRKLSYSRILLSTLFASLVTFAFSDLVQAHAGIKGLMLVAFIMGLIGFKSLERLSDPDGVLSFVKALLELYNNFKK